MNYLLCDAVRQNASGIHIEPDDKSLRVRYRVDGKLSEKMRPPYQMHAAIVSRIKIMAELDVAQHRMPQEGAIRVMVDDRPVDLRVSIMPGSCGEKVAIRVVDPQKRLMALESLGFAMENLQRFRELIQSPYGLVLVTGPAGSGKKTTLRAVISELNRDDVNVCTIEDPLECNIPGVNQFEVNTWMGGSSQDPPSRPSPGPGRGHDQRDPRPGDGQHRRAGGPDRLPGALHPVYQQCPAGRRRLLDLTSPRTWPGMPYLGILSQRLVRKVCSNCKQAYDPSGSLRRAVAKLGQEIPKYTVDRAANTVAIPVIPARSPSMSS